MQNASGPDDSRDRVPFRADLSGSFTRCDVFSDPDRWVSVHAVGCLVRSVAVDTVW